MNGEKNSGGQVMELTFPPLSAESVFQNLGGENTGVVYGPPQAPSGPERNHPGLFKSVSCPRGIW